MKKFIMKKAAALIVAASMCMTMVAGCGNAESAEAGSVAESETVESVESVEETAAETAAETTEATAEEGDTRLVIDHAGVEVEVPTHVERIVVGDFYPMASVLTAYLGSAEKIVGIHPVSMSAAANGLLGEVYPEILDADTSFVTGDEYNIEQLLTLDPDIVIGVGAEQAEAIRAAGIPAVTVSASAWHYDVLETYNQWIALLDQVFGESEKSEQIAAYSQEIYDQIQTTVADLAEEDKKRVMVLFKYSESATIVSGQNFFGQFWCDSVGAINVAGDVEGGGIMPVDMEQIYEWDPEIIIITNFTGTQPEDLYTNAIGSDDWSTVSAVKNQQVYKMPLGMYRTYTPGVDTPVTLQWMANTIYPELFDLDIPQITTDYFKEYFDVDLTDAQLDKMYNPSRNAADGL